jgi:hypothetical protein
VPVQLADENALLVSKFKRLSATSMLQYAACPRSWYHRRVDLLRGPQVPAMMRGHIVENTVSRILRESPFLVPADADSAILTSPLDADERPDRFNPQGFNAPALTPLAPCESLDALRAWARARADIHLPAVKAHHVELFEDHPMSVGSPDDLDDNRMHAMVLATLDWHIEEVEKCLAAEGGPQLATWRSGTLTEWPAPDGFPLDWDEPHPAVAAGACTLDEAWEIARPWFVDPDAGTFTLGAIHPEHWFWGEYDFVYSWDGTVSIVDLKAAVGDNDRSAGYVRQLEMYAWLWWTTHGGTQRVTNLRLWYAGAPNVKVIPAPDEERLAALDVELRDAYEQLFTHRSTDIEDYPATPSPMQLFTAGGVSAGVDADPLKRCETCDHASICPNGAGRVGLPQMETLRHAGRDWPIVNAADLVTRVTICGEVSGLQSPIKGDDGGITIKFNLVQGVDRIEVKNCFFPKPRNITRRIANGVHVRIRNARPTEWFQVPSVEMDDATVLEIIDPADADGESIVGLDTAASVVGRVMTIRDTTWQKHRMSDSKPKWRLALQDGTGLIEVVAYAFAVPPSARSVRPGDDVAILNGVYSCFFDKPEIKFQKSTRLAILRRAED